ncbi:MAG: winged helix-turn-helix transcriptional regulator [Nanoarchaeota archaeon]
MKPVTPQVVLTEGEKTVEKTVEKILQLIKDNSRVTQEELSVKTGLTRRGIEWNINKLKEEGLIKRIGSDREGYWEIMKVKGRK